MADEKERDEQLWRTARKRANFRRSLFVYVVINAFLWAIWWFTTWPFFGLLGLSLANMGNAWLGIGIAFQYFDAYHGSKQELEQQEYEKLKREKGL